MDTVNIVYASNDAYAFLAGISMTSLFENNSEIQHLQVFILSDGITGDNEDRLYSIGENYGREVEIIDVSSSLRALADGDILSYANATDTGNTCNSKLLIGKLLPNLDKALYLDCDTIIQGSIQDLYITDLGSFSIGMAYDCINDRYKIYNGLGRGNKYYNSGVILFDLRNWNSRDCLKRIIYHVNNIRNDYPLPDQDLINIVLHDEIKCLDMKYNYLSQYFLYDHRGNCYVYGHDGDAFWHKDEWIPGEKAGEEVVIFHFCGNTFIRPWYINSRHPMKKKYDDYYNMSPWKDRKQETYNVSPAYRIQLLLYRFFPRFIQVIMGKLMQRIFIWKTYGV